MIQACRIQHFFQFVWDDSTLRAIKNLDAICVTFSTYLALYGKFGTMLDKLDVLQIE